MLEVTCQSRLQEKKRLHIQAICQTWTAAGSGPKRRPEALPTDARELFWFVVTKSRLLEAVFEVLHAMFPEDETYPEEEMESSTVSESDDG